MRKVTLSPTHGPVGDPLQIYADRFFGHYDIKGWAEFVRELAQFEHIVEAKVSIDGTREFHDRMRGTGTYDEAVRTFHSPVLNRWVCRKAGRVRPLPTLPECWEGCLIQAYVTTGRLSVPDPYACAISLCSGTQCKHLTLPESFQS